MYAEGNMNEELRPNEMTAEEAIELVLKRPGMFGLVPDTKHRSMKAERDAATERAERRHRDAIALAGRLDKAMDERDAALAAVESVRAKLGEVLPDWSDSGVVAVADILAALDGAPEPEWEYQCTNDFTTVEVLADPEAHAQWCSGRIERRRKAGPWLPVKGESADA